jgi:hypothetical protein
MIDQVDSLRAALDRIAVCAASALHDSDMASGRLGWLTDFYPPEGQAWTFSADLRPSEVEDLHESLSGAAARFMERAVPILLEEMTAAGVPFGERHPDIPRGIRRPAGRIRRAASEAGARHHLTRSSIANDPQLHTGRSAPFTGWDAHWATGGRATSRAGYRDRPS